MPPPVIREAYPALIELFGADRLITDITGNDVAQFVGWRRGHSSSAAARSGALSPFTINDQTLQLKKLINRAKAWNVVFPHGIDGEISSSRAEGERCGN